MEVDLIALAVPFFLLMIVLELVLDRIRGTGYFQLQDALGSLSAGAFNSTTGIFTKLVSIAIYAWVLEHAALFVIPHSWFGLSAGGVLAWLGILIFWDFMYYWKHRLGHEVSVFWAAHSVHHQSEEYNLTTALRQTSSDFLVGWVVYLPMFLVGVPVHVFATVAAIDLIYQFWVHTRHVDKLGWADRVFVTPSNHRVHHAQNSAYIDKNYGGILILWDRLFGTYAAENDDDPVVFGVRKPLASFNPLTANLQVYRYLWFDARRARRWRDKWSIWWRRTGWRPEDVVEAFPAKKTDLARFEKYAVALSPGARVYIVLQFLVALVLTLMVGIVAGVASLFTVFLFCIMLWMLLTSIGMISDASRHAWSFESLRLVFNIPVAALFGWQFDAIGATDGVFIALIYATASWALCRGLSVFAEPQPLHAS
ncbi:MAG: sterol desaturase family protein [Pseudomonadota bacterium]